MSKEYSVVPAHWPLDTAETEGAEGLDLQLFAKVIRNHFVGILAFTVSIVALVYLILRSETPIYRATATLIIEPQETKIASAEDLFSGDTKRQDYLQTQYEILKSRSLARKVIENLDLINHKEFRPESRDRGDENGDGKFGLDWRNWLALRLPNLLSENKVASSDRMDKAIDIFLKRLTVSPVRDTELVTISFDSTDPKIARRVANSIGQAYLETDLEVRSRTASQASAWLTNRLDGLRKQVTDSERRLQEYLKRENLTDVSGMTTWNADQLSKLTTELIAARKNRFEVETQYSQIKGFGNRIPENFENIPVVFRDEAVRNLKQQENDALATLNEIVGRYGRQHPERVAAEAHLESIHRALRKQISSIQSGLGLELNAARANEMAISREVEEVKRRIEYISSKKDQLQELQREAQSSRDLYEIFMKRHNETSETVDMRPPNARVLDVAPLPTTPFKPNMPMGITVALILALFSSVGVAILAAVRDKSFNSPEEVEKQLGVPLLGTLPVLKSLPTTRTDNLIYQYQPHSEFSESLRSIRTILLFSNMGKVILVTSSKPGEGKTTLAANMAFCLGQMQKVLVIEADLRHPSLAKHIGLPVNGPGLYHAIEEGAALTDCICTTDGSDIDVLPSGLVAENPLELLSSPRFSELVEQLKRCYDVILIDAPPTGPMSDALALSRVADAVIYMVRAGTTPAGLARAGLGRLRKISAPRTGVVLSYMDAGGQSDYSEAYYYS